MTVVLHPDLEPLRALLGTWSGTGTGSYPTIESFSYVEEVIFGHIGKPFLAYSQKTRNATTDLPLHAETGYWRLIGQRQLEVVLAHPTGILELQLGSLDHTADGAATAAVMDLRSSAMVGSPTAKAVTEVHRRFELAGDVLRYELSMAAVGLPLTHHLSAELHRA
jgi:hypothetical protein